MVRRPIEVLALAAALAAVAAGQDATTVRRSGAVVVSGDAVSLRRAEGGDLRLVPSDPAGRAIVDTLRRFPGQPAWVEGSATESGLAPTELLSPYRVDYVRAARSTTYVVAPAPGSDRLRLIAGPVAIEVGGPAAERLAQEALGHEVQIAGWLFFTGRSDAFPTRVHLEEFAIVGPQVGRPATVRGLLDRGEDGPVLRQQVGPATRTWRLEIPEVGGTGRILPLGFGDLQGCEVELAGTELPGAEPSQRRLIVERVVSPGPAVTLEGTYAPDPLGPRLRLADGRPLPLRGAPPGARRHVLAVLDHGRSRDPLAAHGYLLTDRDGQPTALFVRSLRLHVDEITDALDDDFALPPSGEVWVHEAADERFAVVRSGPAPDAPAALAELNEENVSLGPSTSSRGLVDRLGGGR